MNRSKFRLAGEEFSFHSHLFNLLTSNLISTSSRSIFHIHLTLKIGSIAESPISATAVTTHIRESYLTPSSLPTNKLANRAIAITGGGRGLSKKTHQASRSEGESQLQNMPLRMPVLILLDLPPLVGKTRAGT